MFVHFLKRMIAHRTLCLARSFSDPSELDNAKAII